VGFTEQVDNDGNEYRLGTGVLGMVPQQLWEGRCVECSKGRVADFINDVVFEGKPGYIEISEVGTSVKIIIR
jgi:hypothetical protein